MSTLRPADLDYRVATSIHRGRDSMEEFVRYLKALVYLQAQQINLLEEAAVKAEVLLAKAGLPHREIAEILGKTEAAVSKAVSRAKGPGKK